jgi:hypothetical protein
MRVLRRLAVLVLVLVGGLLAGCGGGADDPPSAGPSPSSTPTPTASAPPSAPVLPEAAKANTKAGAVAFVKFYVAAFNHAQATGDTKPLIALEGAHCNSCQKVREAIEGTYQAGGHAEGGTLAIDGSEVHRSIGKQWVVDIVGHFAPSRIYPSAGASPQADRGGKTAASFFVTFRDEWKVVRWTRAT